MTASHAYDLAKDEVVDDKASSMTSISGGYFSPSFVFSDIDLEKNYEDESISTHAFGGSIVLGYEFESNIFVQIEEALAYNFSMGGASDRYSLKHSSYQLGYRFSWEKVAIMPLYGKAKWRLTSKEGQLLNSGSEAVKTIRGRDDLWGMSFLGRVNKHTEALLSYKRINADFGRYSMLNMGVLYKF